jgi:hypothetical protein
MKKVLLYPPLFLLLLFVQCSPENDEDLYYEPLVEGIFNVSVDPGQALDFTIEPNKALSVDGEFDNGIPFTIEFESGALQYNEAVEASIKPLTGIMGMPSEFQFQFGFVLSPEGTYFTKPGKMTIELPPNIDISEFKGFFFQGGVPYGNEDPEIWSVKLTPMLYQSENGKKQAVIEIPHFSGFVGVSGGDFECGNPLAAEMCEQLKEILACYITGKESLTDNDREKVNKALKDWMDSGLDWLEEHPEEFDDDWEISEAIGELLCWKAAALMFNATMAPFENQLNRVGDLFTTMLIDLLVSLNQECLAQSDMTEQAYSFGFNFDYFSVVDEMRNAGFLNEDPGITHLTYCNGIATNYYLEPFLDTTLRDDIWVDHGTWNINLGWSTEAVAQSNSFQVYATNLLGETVSLTLDEDYTIENANLLYHSISGTTITEVIQTCIGSDGNGNPCCPYACYLSGSCNFDIVLTSSGQSLRVYAGRSLY